MRNMLVVKMLTESFGTIHEIGTKAPKGIGLYDMSGNVWEWREDDRDKKAYYKHATNQSVDNIRQ